MQLPFPFKPRCFLRYAITVVFTAAAILCLGFGILVFVSQQGRHPVYPFSSAYRARSFDFAAQAPIYQVTSWSQFTHARPSSMQNTLVTTKVSSPQLSDRVQVATICHVLLTLHPLSQLPYQCNYTRTFPFKEGQLVDVRPNLRTNFDCLSFGDIVRKIVVQPHFGKWSQDLTQTLMIKDGFPDRSRQQRIEALTSWRAGTGPGTGCYTISEVTKEESMAFRAYEKAQHMVVGFDFSCGGNTQRLFSLLVELEIHDFKCAVVDADEVQGEDHAVEFEFANGHDVLPWREDGFDDGPALEPSPRSDVNEDERNYLAAGISLPLASIEDAWRHEL